MGEIQLPPGNWGDCGFQWETNDMRGSHVCIKDSSHATDHKCCCGHEKDRQCTCGCQLCVMANGCDECHPSERNVIGTPAKEQK